MTDKTPSLKDTWAQLTATFREAVEQARAEMAADREKKGTGSVPGELVFEPVRGATGPVHLLPSRGYDDDAGLDLYVARDYEIGPNEFVDVASGVKVDIPHGLWAMIIGRSSTLRKKGLLVNPGVIDAGWTGELFAGVQNMTDKTVEVAAGDRLAQLILLPAPVVGLEPVWGTVPAKLRGTNGFGSTGA